MFLKKLLLVSIVLGASNYVLAGEINKIPPVTKTLNGATSQARPSSPVSTKVNLNKATLKELLAVSGITRPKAHSIMAYRKKHNGFQAVDDLAKLKGFKKMKPGELKKIYSQLSIE